MSREKAKDYPELMVPPGKKPPTEPITRGFTKSDQRKLTKEERDHMSEILGTIPKGRR